MKQEPMTDRTFAVFDAPGNRHIVSKIGRLGGEILSLPVTPTECTALDLNAARHLENLKDFDWLIFTDVFAVDCFLERLAAVDFDLYELDAQRICAAGESVADRLRFVQVHADIVPQKNGSEEIIAALAGYIGGENPFETTKMLLFCAAGDDALFKALQESGIQIEKIAIYEWRQITSADLTRIKTLIRGGAADELVVASPEDFLRLKQLFSQPAQLTEYLEKITAADEISRQILYENHIESEILAK